MQRIRTEEVKQAATEQASSSLSWSKWVDRSALSAFCI